MIIQKVDNPGFLNALSYSPENDASVIAGREVLSIISSSNENKKVVKLRTGSKLNLNYSSNDVQWCPSYASDIIVTAATNGSIVVWNAIKVKQDRVISEHLRAVNRISVNPKEPILLLSASQDGLVKLWDLREKSPAKMQFDGKSESVRDVSFNPQDSYYFASSHESGSIKFWDIRNPNLWDRSISAHNGIALCLDWRSDGRLLATGGRDKLVKVWDCYQSTGNDLRRPIHTIQMIASVGRVKWRPGGQGKQIAACSLLTDYRVLLWDIEKPFVPVLCFENHKNVTSGICWKSRDILLSVSKDRFYIEQTYESGYAPSSLATYAESSWNTEGKIACFLQRSIESGSLLQICQEFPIETKDYNTLAQLAEIYVLDARDEDGNYDGTIQRSIEMNTLSCIRLGLEDEAAVWEILGEAVDNEEISPELKSIILDHVGDFFEELCEKGQIQIVATFCIIAQDLLDYENNRKIEMYINQYLGKYTWKGSIL